MGSHQGDTSTSTPHHRDANAMDGCNEGTWVGTVERGRDGRHAYPPKRYVFCTNTCIGTDKLYSTQELHENHLSFRWFSCLLSFYTHPHMSNTKGHQCVVSFHVRHCLYVHCRTSSTKRHQGWCRFVFDIHSYSPNTQKHQHKHQHFGVFVRSALFDAGK